MVVQTHPRPKLTDTLASGGRPGRTSANSLALNFFPIRFDGTPVRLWVGHWKGPEAAAALEQEIPGLHTWRDRDDGSRMYAWHRTRVLEQAPSEMQSVTVELEEGPLLYQRLLRVAVAEQLLALGFQEKRALPSGTYFVNYKKPSLLVRIPALTQAASEPIGIYPKIYVSPFFTRDATTELVMVLVVDVLYTTRLDIPAAEWIAAGLEEQLHYTYVSLLPTTPEAAQFPEHAGRIIGQISKLRNDACVLTDLREPALATVSLASVAPEPTRHNLALYLKGRYEAAYESGERALVNELRKLVRPRERLRLARALVRRRLQKTGPMKLTPGLTAEVDDVLHAGGPSFPARRLVGPSFSFDRAGSKLAQRIDRGLTDHGPYDDHLMSQRAFRILVLAPREHEGEVRIAMQKLLGGIKTKANVFGGLRRMYRLEDLELAFEWAEKCDGSPMRRYADALHKAIQETSPRIVGEPRFDLVLTVIHDAHRTLPDSENPYLQTKAMALISEGIPTQAVTIDKLRQSDDGLQYILNTMSLACYAKLGGTSHVLRLPDSDDSSTELVFGIGRAIHRQSRFGDATQTVGFATVFRANGEYLYNDSTPYCSDADYEQALEQTIRRTVERIAAFEQLPDGAPLRLIFHVPRQVGRREERAVLNAVGKLPRFEIEFALLHVNDDHHLHLFDLGAQGSKTRRSKGTDAALLPSRGWSVQIGPRERLVTFVGPGQYRGQGFPTPLRLTLDRRSTFEDLDYLTQQLYLMSFMSARSLNPGIEPATLIYAGELAKLTGHLRGVQQWTVELIQQRLGRKLWFV